MRGCHHRNRAARGLEQEGGKKRSEKPSSCDPCVPGPATAGGATLSFHHGVVAAQTRRLSRTSSQNSLANNALTATLFVGHLLTATNKQLCKRQFCSQLYKIAFANDVFHCGRNPWTSHLVHLVHLVHLGAPSTTRRTWYYWVHLVLLGAPGTARRTRRSSKTRSTGCRHVVFTMDTL